MMPRPIRLLGATVPESPSAEPGTIAGNPNPAAAETRMVDRRKSRREPGDVRIGDRFMGGICLQRSPAGKDDGRPQTLSEVSPACPVGSSEFKSEPVGEPRVRPARRK